MRPIDADFLIDCIKPLLGTGEVLFDEVMKKFIGILEATPTIDAVGEWIPCSERLPEYRELVIITTRDLRVKLAYLDSIYDNHTDDLWDMPLDNAECALWNVVAWMPLPKPYGERKGG